MKEDCYVEFCGCSCSNQYIEAELLLWAPCPPPLMTYEEVRDHALSRDIEISTICKIAKRCNIHGINESDCQQDESLNVFLILFLIVGGLISFFLVYTIYKCRRLKNSKCISNEYVEMNEPLNQDKKILQENIPEQENISVHELSEETFPQFGEKSLKDSENTEATKSKRHLIDEDSSTDSNCSFMSAHGEGGSENKDSADKIVDAVDSVGNTTGIEKDPPIYKSFPYIDSDDASVNSAPSIISMPDNTSK